MDIYEQNRLAWNGEAERRNFWTLPVSDDEIRRASSGSPGIRLTPFKAVPLAWVEDLRGKDVLVACGGGGQQTPLLAAYGCNVTSVDISEAQLEQDRLVLENHSLKAALIRENILNMPFSEHCFDCVMIPQAMNFIDDLALLYAQVHRVLRQGGSLMFGIANPVLYMFDDRIQEKRLRVRYTIPFSDTVSLSQKQLERRLAKGDTVEFSHTVDSILGGLTREGFAITGFFSDESGSSLTDSFFHDSHFAVLARL